MRFSLGWALTLTLSHNGEKGHILRCDYMGEWSVDMACFVFSGWTFRPQQRPRPREWTGVLAGMEEGWLPLSVMTKGRPAP